LRGPVDRAALTVGIEVFLGDGIFEILGALEARPSQAGPRAGILIGSRMPLLCGEFPARMLKTGAAIRDYIAGFFASGQ
jgi:hypothetical protein